jgi:hypothetical protein
MTPPVRRVGVVAKRGLHAASDHLERLSSWLRERQIDVVYEAETAGLAGAPVGVHTASREDLPRHVDLVVVLGGDGTLLGMATRIAQSGLDVPLLGVNFGSLGFLTETRIDELYTTLDAAVAGTAEIDERAMLSADVYRSGAHFDARIALNDVVFTKAALSHSSTSAGCRSAGPGGTGETHRVVRHDRRRPQTAPTTSGADRSTRAHSPAARGGSVPKLRRRYNVLNSDHCRPLSTSADLTK